MFIQKLIKYCKSLDWVTTVSEQQIMAWNIEFDTMQKTLLSVVDEAESDISNKAWISFEHELFGESGKRAADVNLILPSGELFLVEFKHKPQASAQEI
ncbi:MAG: hypothetical protein RR231_15920, partial [Acinetobacter sp.]